MNERYGVRHLVEIVDGKVDKESWSINGYHFRILNKNEMVAVFDYVKKHPEQFSEIKE